MVLTREEVESILTHRSGTAGLMIRLLYGTGIRIMECVRLRVKDVDFARGEIVELLTSLIEVYSVRRTNRFNISFTRLLESNPILRKAVQYGFATGPIAPAERDLPSLATVFSQTLRPRGVSRVLEIALQVLFQGLSRGECRIVLVLRLVGATRGRGRALA